MRYIIFTVFFFACLLPVSGQYRLETSRKTDTTRTKDSAAVIPAPAPASPQPPTTYRRAYTEKADWMIKANPLLLIRGQLPLYVEYRISNHFSVEGAVGITYLDLFYETAINGGYFLANNRAKFRNGFLAAAQFRYFPSRFDAAPYGFYTGPQLAARNYQMYWYTNTGFIYEKELEERRMYDMRWVAGWQNPDNREQWFFDFYAALGMRYIHETRVAEVSGVTLPEPKRFIPSGEIGFKLGYTL